MLRLIAEAQKALGDMPMLFAMPLVTFTVLLAFLFYWMLTAIMIYSFQQFGDLGETINAVSEGVGAPAANVTLAKQGVNWAHFLGGILFIGERLIGQYKRVEIVLGRNRKRRYSESETRFFICLL